MRIGLYNVDSTIPNLALMKIAAFHNKVVGDEVAWCESRLQAETFDQVFGSQIFTDSKRWDAPNLVMGGSGFDKQRKLPQPVDAIDPDYSIYPDYKDSLGFTTRGCIRKCHFCFVPEMEGGIRDYRAVEDVWRGGNLILLDNNILAFPGKFQEVLRFCKEKKIRVEFNQGLDCRLMTDEMTQLFLDNIRYMLKPKFAFDDIRYVHSVEKFASKVKHLGHKLLWYVYADENWESALERCLILKRLNQKPYLMRKKSIAKEKKYVILAHWCNNVVGAFWKRDFWEHYLWYANQKGVGKNVEHSIMVIDGGGCD